MIENRLAFISRRCRALANAEETKNSKLPLLEQILDEINPGKPFAKQLFWPFANELVEKCCQQYEKLLSKIPRRQESSSAIKWLINTEIGDTPELFCIQKAEVDAEKWASMEFGEVATADKFSACLLSCDDLEDVYYENVASYFRADSSLENEVEPRQLILVAIYSTALVRALKRIPTKGNTSVLSSNSVGGHFYFNFQDGDTEIERKKKSTRKKK